MDVTDLTPATLAALATPRPRPVVTIAMPTHRREPDNEQDPLRLKNLLAEARRRIEADETVSRQERIDVLDHLDKAAAEVDLRHSQDGLLLFATPAEHQVWKLPRTVPARVVLSETFLTRNLVAARAVYEPYWVLTLAAHRVRLWGGAGNDLAQSTAAGFPQEPKNLEKFDPQRVERIGDVPSSYDGEDTRTFFREVDLALGGLLKEDARPVYLVGVPEAVSLFDAVSTHKEAVCGRVEKGGLGDGPVTALAPALKPAREERALRQRREALARLDQAAGRKNLAAGLDELWQSAHDGRVEELVVEEHHQETVIVTDGHLEFVGDPAATGSRPGAGEGAGAAGDVREDAVDEIVEQTLRTGGRVTFVMDGVLTGRGGMAAALRY